MLTNLQCRFNKMSLDGSPHKTSLCIDRIDPLTNMLWPDIHRNLILYFPHKRWFSGHWFRIPWGLDEMWLPWIRRINCNICIYLEIFFSYCTSKYVLGVEKWKHPEFYLSRWPPSLTSKKNLQILYFVGEGLHWVFAVARRLSLFVAYRLLFLQSGAL